MSISAFRGHQGGRRGSTLAEGLIMSENSLVSFKNAGARLSLAEKTARNWLWLGKFPVPTYKIGRKLVVKASEPDEYIDRLVPSSIPSAVPAIEAKPPTAVAPKRAGRSTKYSEAARHRATKQATEIASRTSEARALAERAFAVTGMRVPVPRKQAGIDLLREQVSRLEVQAQQGEASHGK